MLLHIASDGLIAAACFAIPFSIAQFVKSRRDLDSGHRALALLFAAFIGLCGLTHVMGIVTMWQPIYISAGWLKAVTAIASVVTAIALHRLIPRLLAIPSPKALQLEIEARRIIADELDAARAQLALRVDHTEGELRTAVQQQQQSDALLRTIVETAPGLIFPKDLEGRLLLANKATLAVIGKPWVEVERKTDREFLDHPDRGEVIMTRDRAIMAGGVAQELEENAEHPVKGARTWLSTKTPMFDADGLVTGLVGMSFDITEPKQLEARLRQESRLSAMGEMAAALAHELNQPLGSIINYVEGCRILVARESSNSPLLGQFDKAIGEALRAGQIIRHLRSFVSSDDNVRLPEVLPVLVDEACAFSLLGASSPDVALDIRHDGPETKVLVDRIQIEQVIHNLIRNAIEATAHATRPVLQVRTARFSDEMAVISIADNGAGLDPEVATTLFERFVSTKGKRGMGVGLSIGRTIVEAHGGRIWAEPARHGGTVFQLTLPLAASEDGE
ncbi:ATP-binding protein [Brevundimonas sp.]|uniref:PAS domain-containing sensor histidine kinase n=1 Tax=Brevundimonas sp. TaxID=1871086 RepID=UPI00286D03E2|nr:ATP-binding protein [Brevundimonas sp.]